MKIPDGVLKAAIPEPDESVFDLLCRALELKTQAGREALIVALTNIKLLDNKQLDYGSKNISGFGTFGVLVRMNDKFERLKNLFNNRRRKATNESILDSFDDISNYAIIARLVETHKWPSE
jgi:hypothetical protein